MPPSPALRYSPGREPRVEKHKRGRSLEGGLLFKENDDDLALFNEVQSRERENFLLQSTDDFEDTFTAKLRHFSDLKLGISIPVRGESSELLNAEGEKNDYDWLLTPPDTPLFPSLDDEPQPTINATPRGRPRSKPISISRSSTMEKSYGSSRGSASPNRLSLSPRSGNSTFQSKGRPSSAPHSNPIPSQRPSTPSHRPSPPPIKASTSAPRSSTPTPRRTSTGSGARGTSPIRANRGNSVSPKIRAWQSNIPGFSSEVPPNLRTSLADRPASYVRGSSPASRNGRDSSSKFGRQSMSPTASRSISSSHSQDRDHISSHSKGSVASSGDDDVDSLQSIHVGSLDRLASKRVGTLPTNRALAFSKKSTRIFSPSSAPKRSFDSALRQMDHRKSPQNMFRPLLSSVPSTTFYAGKASSAHRSLISRNSSVTTSSNTSSDQGTSIALDTEGCDNRQEDVAVESGKATYPDVQEEVFAFDMDALNKDVKHDVENDLLHLQLGDFDRDPTVECEPGDSEEFSHQDVDIEISSAYDTSCVKVGLSEVESLESTKVCSKCGCRYHIIETVEKDIDMCPDCSREDNLVAATTLETTPVAAENSQVLPMKISEEHSEEYNPHDEPEQQLAVSESQSQVVDMVEARVLQHEDNLKQDETQYNEQSHVNFQETSFTVSEMEGVEQQVASQQGTAQPTVGNSLPDKDTGSQLLPHSNDYPNLKVGASEGAGISLLLKRSSSNKGPVVRSKSFIASTITYDDLLYARDSTSSLRSSIGHGSTSASSSVDFSSARQVETRVQWQLSSRKSDIENYRYDVNTRPRSTGSSLSGNFNQSHQALDLATSTHEEGVEVFVGDVKHNGAEETHASSHSKVVSSENKEMDISSRSFTSLAVPDEDLFEQNESSRTMNSSTSNLSCQKADIQIMEHSVPFHESKKEFPGTSEPSIEVEHTMADGSQNGMEITDSPSNNCLASISETEIENYYQSPHPENGNNSTHSENPTNEFQDSLASTPSDKDIIASIVEHKTSDDEHGILGDSTVMVECHRKSKAKSLTLEEATDTILFCSSIVHDLAYQAATIAMDKENSSPLEGSRPTVTVLGKSTADKKELRGRTAGRRNSRSQKVKQRQMETDVKAPSGKTENDENANESMVQNVGLPNNIDGTKPPKLESKCNCTIM